MRSFRALQQLALVCLTLTVSLCRSQDCPATTTNCFCDDRLGIQHIVCQRLGYDAALPLFNASTTIYESLTVSDMTIIRTVGPGAFRGIRVNRLQLQSNGIETLDVGAFGGLDTDMLLEIYLERNYITAVATGTFSDLTSLTTLNMENNAILRLDPGLFADLTSLQYLHLDNNRLSSLSTGLFTNLDQLLELYLFNNDLSVISSDTFQGLVRLERLELQGNQLVRIESGAWNSLSGLFELHMQNNQLGPEVTSPLFQGLDQLEVIDLSNNFITRLSSDVFIRTQRLDTIILNNNQVREIDQPTFTNLAALRTLRLAGNRLRQLPDRWLENTTSVTRLYLERNGLRSLSEKTLQGLASLQNLYLSENKLRRLNGDMFADLARLSFLELNENEINEIAPMTFRQNALLSSINLRGNELKTVPNDVFSGADLTRLRTIHLDDNDIETIHTDAFKNRNSLTTLTLSKNDIFEITDGTFDDLTRLTSLSLDANDITNLSSSLLSQLRSLRVLELNHNELETIANNPFFTLQQLRRLNLANNLLTFIERGTFGNLGRLQNLDLSSNLFSSLATDLFVGDLTSLTHLNISYNLLGELQPDTFVGLQRVTTLDLRYNLLRTLRNESFGGLMSLENLYLDKNNLSSIASASLIGLDALQELSLSDNRLEADSLVHISNLKALTTVRLDNNVIRYLPSGAFAQCPLFDSLSLRQNLLPSLADDVSMTISLPSTVKHLDIGYNLMANSSVLERLADFFPRLESLQLDGNKLWTLPRSMLQGAKSTVSELDFSSNRLTSAYVFGSIRNLTGLSVLNVDHNLVDGIPADVAEQLSQTVTRLSMRYNRVNSAGMSTLSRFTRLTELLLDVNRIHEFPSEVFARMFSLEKLTVSDNLLQQLSNDSFYGAASRTLTHVSLADNHISTVSPLTFVRMGQLVYLDLTDNQITELTLPPAMPQLNRLLVARNQLASFPAGLRWYPRIQNMDLSFNRVMRLPPVIIENYDSEISMNLANNQLTDIDAPRLAGKAARLDFGWNQLRRMSSTSNLFSALTVVTDVDFSHNLLPEVPDAVVNSLDAIRGTLAFYSNHIFTLNNWHFTEGSEATVRTLVLRRNIISELPDNFTRMLGQRLSHLDLRDNLLLTLDQSEFVIVPPDVDLGNNESLANIDWSEYMVMPELEQLDLGYNLWRCDCQLAWLRLLASQLDVDMATCAKPTELIGHSVFCYEIPSCEDPLANAARNITCEDGRPVYTGSHAMSSFRLSWLVVVIASFVQYLCRA